MKYTVLQVIVLLIALLQVCNARVISYSVTTRKVSFVSKKQREPEEFADYLRNKILKSEQPDGYCFAQDPQFPLNNQGLCGSKQNIGWVFMFRFEDPEDATYTLDFGVDFGMGSAIYIDGSFYSSYHKDLWWAGNWNSNAVFSLTQDFSAGSHVIAVYGAEKCCDGLMNIRFSRNDSGFKQFNMEELLNTIPVGDEESSSSDGCAVEESDNTVVPEETQEEESEPTAPPAPTAEEQTTDEEDTSEEEAEGYTCKFTYGCDEYEALVNYECGGVGKSNNDYIDCAVDILEQQISDCTPEDREYGVGN